MSVILTLSSMLLLVFVVCSTFTVINSALDRDDAKQLVSQEQVGGSLYNAYRSLLLNPLSARTSGRVSFPVSAPCVMELQNIKSNTQKLLKYLDATGKPLRSGTFRGNRFWLGSYSGCEALSDSKYCLSMIEFDYPPENITIKDIIWGACFPERCSVKDLFFVMNFLIVPEVTRSTGSIIKYPGSICPSGPTYTTGVKVTLVFCGILLLHCLIGTVIDLVIDEREKIMAAKELLYTNGGMSEALQAENPGDEHVENILDHSAVKPDDQAFLVPPSRTFFKRRKLLFSLFEIIRDFFLCFSLVRNSQKIFNTNVPSTAITCINGIRVISIFWVILGHTVLTFLLSPLTDNKMAMFEDSQLFRAMPVINPFYSVDSFFFLSGLLVAYTCFRKLEKCGGVFKFNWFLFYFHRFWRITPTYMAVVLVTANLTRFLAKGPIWYFQMEGEHCREYWWNNLLYINNFRPKNFLDGCVGQSWYLANDMQFFIITPPLLVLMYKFGRRGLIGPGILLGASTAAIAYIIGNWQIDPFLTLRHPLHITPEDEKRLREFNAYLYTKPWCRVQPYLVGFILGYYIYKSPQHYYNRWWRPAVTWLVTILGWAIAASLGMWLVYGPHKYIVNGADEWPLAWRVAYGMLHRLLWGLVVAWVTYACHFGGGSLVQKFLSAKFWIPLSRLTFSVYLIHILVLCVMLSGAQGTVHYDVYNLAYYFTSATVLSYAAAYILAVTIEFPSENVEYLILKLFRGSRRQMRL